MVCYEKIIEIIQKIDILMYGLFEFQDYSRLLNLIMIVI